MVEAQVGVRHLDLALRVFCFLSKPFWVLGCLSDRRFCALEDLRGSKSSRTNNNSGKKFVGCTKFFFFGMRWKLVVAIVILCATFLFLLVCDY